MVHEDAIRQAVQILRDAADPVRIILFGSYARGDATDDSDLDFLVVEKSVERRYAEMVRLRKALAPLRIPVDVIVASEKVFREWSDTPGNVLYEAALEGKVLYEAA